MNVYHNTYGPSAHNSTELHTMSSDGVIATLAWRESLRTADLNVMKNVEALYVTAFESQDETMLQFSVRLSNGVTAGLVIPDCDLTALIDGLQRIQAKKQTEVAA